MSMLSFGSPSPTCSCWSASKDELEQRLLRTVDVVTYRNDMNRFLKQTIDAEAVYA